MHRIGPHPALSQAHTMAAQVDVLPVPGGPWMRVRRRPSITCRTAARWLSFSGSLRLGTLLATRLGIPVCLASLYATCFTYRWMPLLLMCMVLASLGLCIHTDDTDRLRHHVSSNIVGFVARYPLFRCLHADSSHISYFAGLVHRSTFELEAHLGCL